MPTVSMPASAASGAAEAAQKIRVRPWRRAPSAAASTPGTGRTRPSSPSSPIAACPRSASSGTCREAASKASAIGRSKAGPSFRSSAGARLTTILGPGQRSCADAKPLRTRCFASWQARSGRPTSTNAAEPSWTWASTSTRLASSPTSACVIVCASMRSTLAGRVSRVRYAFVPER